MVATEISDEARQDEGTVILDFFLPNNTILKKSKLIFSYILQPGFVGGLWFQLLQSPNSALENVTVILWSISISSTIKWMTLSSLLYNKLSVVNNQQME